MTSQIKNHTYKCMYKEAQTKNQSIFFNFKNPINIYLMCICYIFIIDVFLFKLTI